MYVIGGVDLCLLRAGDDLVTQYKYIGRIII